MIKIKKCIRLAARTLVAEVQYNSMAAMYAPETSTGYIM
jgi:hypothetical protein